MKDSFKITLLASLLLLVACTEKKERRVSANPNYSQPMSIDTANLLIQSYLDGINYKVNTEETKSFSVDANVLRQFLEDNDGKIVNVKFVLAHNLDYVHSAHRGQRPDTNSHVLTMVIAGYDKDGNYLYTPQGMAIEAIQPCPPVCPTGDAGNNLLLPSSH